MLAMSAKAAAKRQEGQPARREGGLANTRHDLRVLAISPHQRSDMRVERESRVGLLIRAALAALLPLRLLASFPGLSLRGLLGSFLCRRGFLCTAFGRLPRRPRNTPSSFLHRSRDAFRNCLPRPLGSSPDRGLCQSSGRNSG